MKNLIIVAFFILINISTKLYSQNITINGLITDENNEPLIGATVVVVGSILGNTTNQYGFYSLTINKGDIHLLYSFVGFEKQTTHLFIQNDTTINIHLKSQTLNEIEIKEQHYKVSEQISHISLPINQIKKIPSLAGEADIIKALALTPGIVSGTEGSAGLYVRGGTPDQNLILLDEAVVYNPNHLFGFVSVFNPDVIKNVDLIKGGFPARYGGRLSSVVDVSMKEGSTNKKKTNFGIGVVASRLTIERPLIKDKMGFIFSARSSYLNLLLFPTWIEYQETRSYAQYISYNMYDINAKINYKIDDKNQLFLSFYNGKDNFKSYDKIYKQREERSKLNWGNSTLTLRHNKILSSKMFWKNMVAYSRFGYNLNLFDTYLDSSGLYHQYKNFSGLNDISFKSAIDYIPNNKHYVRMGTELIVHQFTPQSKTYVTNDSLTKNFNKEEHYQALEASVFAEDEWQITNALKTNIGLRLNNYRLKEKAYYSLEPRLSVSYAIYKNWHLKGAFSRMQQNIHLLTNNGIGLQNDIWVPSTAAIRPQNSQEWAAGISKYFPQWDIELSIEGYYKSMFHLIDFKEGANIVNNLDNWAKSVENNGLGWSHGLEFFLHKKTGPLNGFISYTLSKTERQFEKINLGAKYPFRYDSRHNLSITGNYQINPKWDFSFTWVYQSGQPITLPVAVFNIPSNFNFYTNEVPVYSKRNGYRLPAYHRGDISLNRTTNRRRGGTKTISLNIFNVYNRRNIMYVEILSKRVFDPVTTKVTNNYTQELRARSLLPIVPSLSCSISY
jgi:outer membrane receptor for ferrienterochelin and colicin